MNSEKEKNCLGLFSQDLFHRIKIVQGSFSQDRLSKGN